MKKNPSIVLFIMNNIFVCILPVFLGIALMSACSNRHPKVALKTDIKERMHKSRLIEYCQKVQSYFDKYSWGESRCDEQDWFFVRTSVKGTPLVWKVYGSEENIGKKESTLILCGVHGDEITPIKFCFDAIHYINKISMGKLLHPETKRPYKLGSNHLVVVAPIVNPDSFFKGRPTRTNANGVDINRNFPTQDFLKDALRTWANHYRSDKRRYPGQKAMSEPETIFQVNLIKRYRPDKIISVHAPLTMLDYDGPSDRVFGGDVGTRANQLLIQMSEEARGYRIKNYPFFTGSLGNYAGNERSIPTYTLELPTSNPKHHRRHWERFQGAVNSAILHEMKVEL